MGTRRNSGELEPHASSLVPQLSREKKRWLSLILLFLLAVVARTPALGRYITPDELIWVYRSVRFREALRAGDWANTIQSGHPGITTTWLGAAAIQTHLLLHPEDQPHLDWINSLHWLSPDNDDAFRHLAVFLTAARWSIILVTSLGLVGMYGLLRPQVGNAAALLSILFLTFDPFTAGLSGIFHVDALLGTFGLLAVLCVVRGMGGQGDAATRGRGERRYVILAGVLTALAVLTKTPGVILLLFIPFFVVAPKKLLANGQRPAASVLRRLLLWAMAGLVTSALVLPALAAAPQHVLTTIRGLNERLLETAVRPTFFWGEVTLEPGWGFYPVTVLMRLSPVVMVGIILAVVRWLAPGDKSPGYKETLDKSSLAARLNGLRLLARAFMPWRTEAVLVGFSVAFLLLLNLAEKKYDRYALPAIMPLIVTAGIGWARLGFRVSSFEFRVFSSRFQVSSFRLAVSDLPGASGQPPAAPFTHHAPRTIALAIHILFFLTALPYPLTAYNWLTGGTAVARRVLPMGWGEGASAAAIQLRDQASDDTRPLLTSSMPSVAPFYPGPVLRYHPDSLVQLSETPYLLLTEQDQQLDPEAFPDDEAAAHVTHFKGLDRAFVYDAQYLPLRPLNIQPVTFSFQQAVSLDQAGAWVTAWPDPLYVGLEWHVQQPSAYQLQLSLLDESGYAWVTQEQPLLNEADQPTTFWQLEERNLVYYRLPLAADIPPGAYTLTVTLFDDTGAQLGVFAADGRFVGVAAAPLAFTLLPPESQPSLDIPNFQPTGSVAGYKPVPIAIGTGEQLILDLWWRVDAAAPLTLTLQTAPFTLPFALDMTDWTPGHVYHIRPTWRIPADAPTGTTALAVNGILLGEITIEARDRVYELPADITPLAVQVGTQALLQQAEVTVTASTIELDVIWQANVPDGVAYTTFVHLRDSSNTNIDQQDRSPALPTDSWVEGQVVSDHFSLARPQSGSYTIALGLYNQANGQRLLLYDTTGQPIGDEYHLAVTVP